MTATSSVSAKLNNLTLKLARNIVETNIVKRDTLCICVCICLVLEKPSHLSTHHVRDFQDKQRFSIPLMNRSHQQANYTIFCFGGGLKEKSLANYSSITFSTPDVHGGKCGT